MPIEPQSRRILRAIRRDGGLSAMDQKQGGKRSNRNPRRPWPRRRRPGPAPRDAGPGASPAEGRPIAAAALQRAEGAQALEAGRRRRHRAVRVGSHADLAGAGGGDLHRLRSPAGARAGRHRPRGVPLGPPPRVGDGPVDQHRRPGRHVRHPGIRREIPPPPAGRGGRPQRHAPAKGRSLRRRWEHAGEAVRHRPHARPERRPPAQRADQHLPRPQHGADIPGEPWRRVGRHQAAHPGVRLAASRQRRELPPAFAARRDRGRLLPDPRVLRRPPRGRRGRGAGQPHAGRPSGTSTG